MRALMLAFSCELSYRTLRAAAAAGYSVHVLGRETAERLKRSRYCSSYNHFNFDPVSDSLDQALAEITHCVRNVSADVIMPMDIVSTRLLVALEGRLPAPTPALPHQACFDMLNDKWQFYQFCKKLGVSVPQTWLYESVETLKTAIAEGGMPLPAIVKPVDSTGGVGICLIKEKADLKILDTVKYKPLLVQKLIMGDEVDISLLANKGFIVAYAIQNNSGGKYQFIRNDKLLELASRIVEANGFHGLAHFDAIQEKSTGDIYLIECNPRVWWSLFACTVSGLNFIKLSLSPESLDPARPLCLIDKQVSNSRSTKRLFKQLISMLVKGRFNKPDYALLKYYLADPVGKRECDYRSPEGYEAMALAALRAQ